MDTDVKQQKKKESGNVPAPHDKSMPPLFPKTQNIVKAAPIPMLVLSAGVKTEPSPAHQDGQDRKAGEVMTD